MSGERYLLDTNAIVALLHGNYQLVKLLQNADWIGIINLIVSQEETAVFKVQGLIETTRTTITDNSLQRDVIELIERVIIYKLPDLSKKELEAMFGLAESKQTQYFKDVRAEALEEGEAKGEAKGRQEGEVNLTIRLPVRLFGSLPPEVETQITTLPTTTIEALAEALLNFHKLEDLTDWLANHK